VSGGTDAGKLFDRAFSLFFVGELISNCGTWLQNVSQGVLIHTITGGSFMVGVANAAMFLPVLLLALPFGVLADRVDRKALLIASQLMAATAVGGLAVIAHNGGAMVGAIIVVSLLVGVQDAVAMPTSFALIPALVTRDQVGRATVATSVTFNLARVLGPAASAVLIASLGYAAAFGLNSLSFIVFAVALLLIRVEPVASQGGALGETLAYVKQDRRMRLMLIGIAVVAVAFDPVITLSPVFAAHVFDQPVTAAGFLVAAYGIGAMASVIWSVRTFRGPVSQRFGLLTPAMLLFAAGLIVFASTSVYWVGLAALCIAGAGSLFAVTTLTAGIQEEIPERMRGRVMGLWTVAFLGPRPFAALLSGSIADVVSPRAAVLVLVVPLVLMALLGAGRLRPGTGQGRR
jgi:MFS family permease